MADQSPRRSRKLHGLSLVGVEPSSRRRRSNYASDFHLVVANASESDPPTRVVVSAGGPSTSDIVERSTPLISRVLFLAE